MKEKIKLKIKNVKHYLAGLRPLRKRKFLSVDEALKKHIDPHAEDKTEFYKRNFFVLSFIILSLALIIGVGIYTGYVSYHAGRGGYIHEINLQFKRPAYNWAAIYGASFGVGVTQPWEFNITPGSTTEANVFFECFESGIRHEIYASTVPIDQLDLNSLQPATYEDINTFIGTNNLTYETSELTFRNNMTIEFGSTTISNILSTYTNVGIGTNVTAFDIGALKDSNGYIVMVAHVYELLTKGFNDRFYNFQMLLPVRNNQSTMYYLFSDPNDICVGGNETPRILGIVQGIVTDSSGNLLEDVVVVVGSGSTVTDVAGFYNLTSEVGQKRIIAIKTGYKVYQSLINVTANNITVHNIVLELDAVQNDFTDIAPDKGPGQDDDGTGVGPGEVPVQIESPQVIEGQDYIIALSSINKKLRIGEFSQDNIFIYSYKSGSVQIDVEILGEVAKLTSLDKKSFVIPTRGEGNFLVTFFANQTPGLYNGTINISGGIKAEIPVQIEILDRDKIPVQAMLIGLSAANKKLYSGSTFTFRTDLTNLLTDREYPVNLLYTIQNMEGTETIWSYQTNVFLKTSVSLLKNVELPSTLPIGDYVLRVTANYMDLSSSSGLVFTVELPFYQYIIFGKIRVWHAFLILLGLGLLAFAALMIKRNMDAKKKYHLKVELSEIPKQGPRSILVGKIAESDNKAFLNLENFKTHTIVAGSTGGGKSFSAQVIIEEMLLKDIAVIVFDPTAQWSGMLRKLSNKGLLAIYPNFGMKESDAKAFKGNIRQINNPRELIDIREYMKPGEIQVFACHKLDPKDIDVFVANTVRQVFHANFEESEPLRLMLVYDEVHRLLPKFGGSGEGFLQIERACREFRKWGIGVMLISQVLADFVGQIKANINTEVQMRTRDEGDLERIKTKYGGDILQSLVKASVGTGMLQNSAYNRGRPYFVTFRPIMHSVARLSDEEIEQYNKFNERIDQVAYELAQLEELKQDVFDLKLELKLALDKVKAGNFNMGQIYLEGIDPRIKKIWEKLGKTPKKKEVKLVSEADIKAELEKAKTDREKYESENKKTEAGAEQKKEDPSSNFKKDVPPDKILRLHNDMLVVNPKALYSEIEAMKDSDYAFHVSDTKNDFADWVRNAIGDSELADLIAQETEKKKIMELLEMREKGQKLPKLVIKKKEPEPQANSMNEKNGPAEVSKEKKQQLSEDSLKAFQEMSKDPNSDKNHNAEIEHKTENKEDKYEDENNEKNGEKKNEEEDEAKKGKIRIHVEKNAPEDKYFRLENGVELKSIKELREYLPKMSDEIFSKHVNKERNDFANWIKYVFHEDDLAEKITQSHTKGSLEEVLMNA